MNSLNKQLLSHLLEPYPPINARLQWYSYQERWSFDRESTMRQFIRHPSDIPIAYSVGKIATTPSASNGNKASTSNRLRDVGYGGLCFNTDCVLHEGMPIHIKIFIGNLFYEAEGQVCWCRSEGEHFSVGVEFSEASTHYSARMVEQICHIEYYRVAVLAKEGRQLDSEQGTVEWIGKYAAEFPDTNFSHFLSTKNSLAGSPVLADHYNPLLHIAKRNGCIPFKKMMICGI